MKKRLLVVGLIAGLMGFALPAAQAGPLEDALALANEALQCRVWADEPGGNPVRGSGGGRCNVGGLPVTVVVCLDYNGVTIASSCKTYRGTGSAGGSSGPAMCLPGLWQTMVTMTHIMGPSSSTHSDPVLLTCLP
ncbi:MAG TPA: hypothetical protein VHJ76_05140 [Actinomycetota bacterium]|nr:hypothetical protein [Actinomycetota bacterium]